MVLFMRPKPKKQKDFTILEILDARVGIILAGKHFAIMSLCGIVRERVVVCIVSTKAQIKAADEGQAVIDHHNFL